MEEDNVILKNWRQQENIFRENLAASRKLPTKACVHDLRVATKRMRSYLRLKQQFNGDEWKESFSKILALFKSFGRLRDYDMSLSLIRKLERKESMSFIFFKEYLSVNRSLSRKWAKNNAIKFDEHETEVFYKQFMIIEGSKEDISEKIIQLSILKIKKVKTLSRHFQKNAHEIRKQLKDVYYWLKICSKTLVENYIDVNALDTVLNHLGHFQDHVVLNEKIRQYRKELPKKNEERAMLKNLERRSEADQKEILNKAMKKWEVLEIKKATKSAALRTPYPD